MYPRTLTIGHILDHERGSPDYLELEEGQIAQSDLISVVTELGDRLLPKVLEVTRVLHLDTGRTASWARTWTADIISGGKEAAACLLIALLPNLEKLQVVDMFVREPFDEILERILKAARDREYDFAGLNSFKRLAEIFLLGECGADLGVLQKFDGLPSLSTIKGRFIVSDWPEQGNSLEPSTERYSNITALELHQSKVNTDSIYACIKGIRSLHRFTYDFCAARGRSTWEPRNIVRVLQAFAYQSLVHLELTGVTDIYSVRFRRGEPFIGNLRAFEVLETLRLETVMLYKEIEGTDDRTPDVGHWTTDLEITEKDWAGGRNALVEPERLIDILPASTKRLRLVGGLSIEEAGEMLADIVELKDERIPSLRRIFFEDVEPSSKISSVCENAGIRARFCGRV